ncbi:OmpA family protein [Pontibacter sp. BT310]|uniref:OmpA family protein n=1 Tax=Pontibacter populi TaxID=890055 RepID=A0ABS6XC83_9BACT|nr:MULTISPECIES: OmpA family protein [Pontibacter]MBJ6118778.1 OmpA family protein [Pontibacter sp. BT310]MBR0571207.1 OmpA family protein [Microvirga sp. STS03]MBW3365632.1 OmpA family protein [Pontibacter populi]
MNQLAKSFSRFSLLLALLCLIAFTASAQSNRKLIRSGNKLFAKENYRAAAPFYEQVLANDPNNAKALYYAGISYMTFDKEKAADYLYRAQKIKPNVDRDLEYWLGRADHINYRFDSAIEHFKAAQKELRRRDEERREELAMLIQHANNAKREVANPKDIFVKNLGGVVNSAYSEHSPVISSDDNYLLYTSRSSEATGGTPARDGEYYEDIFESTRIGEDEWSPTKRVAGALNSPSHDASIQLFDNDTKLLLYRADNNGDIMVAERQADGTWGEPKSIGSNINTKHYESDAFITKDGQTLFFSTSAYSEFGDLDIYVSKRNADGSWAAPKSIGSTINTPFDDDSPYFADNGTLYFASTGHNTMGGYDIFASKYDSVARRWAKPVNMGSPVNTPDDDTYYRLSPDGSYAYLSSYRIGGYGEKDIYTINYIRNVRVQGQVFSKVDSLAIPGVELIFNGQSADKRPISYRDVTRPDSGYYQVDILSGRNFQIQVAKDGKQITTEELEVPMSLNDTTTIVRNFYIDYVDTTATRAGVLAVKPIYFDTDEYNLRPESVSELDRVVAYMKANPLVNISIEGHCDSRASDEYNMTLGENRAVAAYEYLKSKGISERRLVTVSYGERKPAVPNTSSENMQLNRRTEFRVLERADKANQ